MRDSPVPWHCLARCQHIGFKAAMALQPCLQRRNLETSSVARNAPAKFPEGKSTGLFSKKRGEKSGENGEKVRFINNRVQAVRAIQIGGTPHLPLAQENVSYVTGLSGLPGTEDFMWLSHLRLVSPTAMISQINSGAQRFPLGQNMNGPNLFILGEGKPTLTKRSMLAAGILH